MPEFYTLNDFRTSLHKSLLCTDNLADGLKIRRKAYALEHKYIQANDLFIKFLVLDLDYNGSAIAWADENLPCPNIIVKNRENGHCHYIYALELPICKTNNARTAPLEYFAKIQQAYTERLGADPNYVGLITKNPFHSHWASDEFYSWFGYQYAYSLDELADYVDLPHKIERRTAIAEGRNCWLFEEIRKVAYREVLFYKQHGAKCYDFQNFLLQKLEKLNIFERSEPLHSKELHYIAKSVSRWTWRNFTQSKFNAIFSKKQTARVTKRWGKKDKKGLLNEFR